MTSVAGFTGTEIDSVSSFSPGGTATFVATQGSSRRPCGAHVNSSAWAFRIEREGRARRGDDLGWRSAPL